MRSAWGVLPNGETRQWPGKQPLQPSGFPCMSTPAGTRKGVAQPGPDCGRYGYLQSLPQREHLPVFWSKEELVLLKGSEAAKRIAAQDDGCGANDRPKTSAQSHESCQPRASYLLVQRP